MRYCSAFPLPSEVLYPLPGLVGHLPAAETATLFPLSLAGSLGRGSELEFLISPPSQGGTTDEPKGVGALATGGCSREAAAGRWLRSSGGEMESKRYTGEHEFSHCALA